MQRISPIIPGEVEPAAADLLAGVEANLGMVPNVFATMGRSTALLDGFLSLSAALEKASLPAKLQEQIALAVAGINKCDYCASAHTTLGGLAALDAEEMAENLRGNSADAKTQLVLDFVKEIVSERGLVGDTSLMLMRNNGFTDREVLEIFGHVMVNIFTNYFNHLAGTEIDFPAVSTQAELA